MIHSSIEFSFVDRRGRLSGAPSSIVYSLLCRGYCLNHVMVFLRSDWKVKVTRGHSKVKDMGRDRPKWHIL